MYIQCIKYVPKAIQGKGKQKQVPSPYLKFNQSTKPIMDIGWSFMYTLTHSKIVDITLNIIAWSDSSMSLNDLLFLSFHNVKNKRKGATF